MSLDPFFRRMTMIAGIFAMLGVILGVVAMATNYWTVQNIPSSGMPMQTSNGTMMVNERFDWNWNVSCSNEILWKNSFVDHIEGTHLHVYIARKCSMYHTILDNNIRLMFIGCYLHVSWRNIFNLGNVSNK